MSEADNRMEELADRVEAATRAEEFGMVSRAIMMVFPLDRLERGHALRVAAAGGELSAAMMLIPPGWLLHFLQDTEFDNPEDHKWSVSLRLRQGVCASSSEAWTFAATPALALTSAALRARASGAQNG